MKNKIIVVLLLLLIGNIIQAQDQSQNIPRLSPIPTDIPGIDKIRIDLDGTWKFNPVFEESFKELNDAKEWSDITVPGEWSMQGFRVDSGQAAAYFKTFFIYIYSYKS